MSKLLHYIEAFRLRTLPLAMSSIITGAAVAVIFGVFSPAVFFPAMLTTLFLQILSNLANDYGDAMKGADGENRVGPRRLVQSGVVSVAEIKILMWIFASLSVFAGVWLLAVSLSAHKLVYFLLFGLLGLASVWASIKYTVGKRPYGYRAMGDLFVFLFFGPAGVAGSFFLYGNVWNWVVLLPAISIGCFSTGVLNLNNVRDLIPDSENDKITLAVLFGEQMAKQYHYALLLLGWVAINIFFVFCFEPGFWLNLLLPGFWAHARFVHHRSGQLLDGGLKQLALFTFAFSVIFMVAAMLFLN